MFDKLSQQNIRIIQDFISPGESTIGPGESTFFSGESTPRSGETSSGEWAIGRNDRNSSIRWARPYLTLFLPNSLFAGPREARNPNLDSDQRIAFYACAPR